MKLDCVSLKDFVDDDGLDVGRVEVVVHDV